MVLKQNTEHKHHPHNTMAFFWGKQMKRDENTRPWMSYTTENKTARKSGIELFEQERWYRAFCMQRSPWTTTINRHRQTCHYHHRVHLGSKVFADETILQCMTAIDIVLLGNKPYHDSGCPVLRCCLNLARHGLIFVAVAECYVQHQTTAL
jgi:hypothetical protein